MRRLLLLALLAPALVPAPALAGGFNLEFGPPGPGVVRVTGFTDCPAPCDDEEISLSLERAGAVLLTSAPGTAPWLDARLAPGDVVRILRDGVERAAVPYEGAPTVDDVSCGAVGGAVLTGTFRHGVPGMRRIMSPGYGLQVDDYTYLRIALSNVPQPGMTEAAITTAGDRWTATFPRPLAAGDGLLLVNAHTIATPVGEANVGSARWESICPATTPPTTPPGPAPVPVAERPPCSAPALRGGHAALAAAVERLRLRALRGGRAEIAGVPACAGGRLSATVALTGRRAGVVVAKGALAATGARATLALTPTRRAARLAGRRRATVKVSVRSTDAAGGTAVWTRRATLRLR